MRNHYWTCSKFADWLRGTTKGGAKTSEGWAEWEDRAKKDFPIRWWLAEEGLDYLQRIVYWPTDKLYACKYYINNRYITRTHCLTAHPSDIKRGEWRDVGNRFLPCLFNELVDFVEIEQAWHHCIWSDEAKTKFNVPWYRKGWLGWRTWRCPEAGLEYLNWAAGLKMDDHMGLEPGDKGYGEPTYQAKAAKEIIELYTWWTEVYPNRPDPHDASGWTEYCDRMRQEKGEGIRWIGVESSVKETKALGKKSLKDLRKIEEAYEKEDEAMMIRLIKVRNSLWT